MSDPVDLNELEHAIRMAERGFPITGAEAKALVARLRQAEATILRQRALMEVEALEREDKRAEVVSLREALAEAKSDWLKAAARATTAEAALATAEAAYEQVGWRDGKNGELFKETPHFKPLAEDEPVFVRRSSRPVDPPTLNAHFYDPNETDWKDVDPLSRQQPAAGEE